MTPQIDRIRALADNAERQYNEEVKGGEPVYPEWIADARWVCSCAELAYLSQRGCDRATATFALREFLRGGQ